MPVKLHSIAHLHYDILEANCMNASKLKILHVICALLQSLVTEV